MNKKNKRFLIILLSICVLVFLDRVTKIWAESCLPDNNVEIIKGALRLELLPGGNKGAAWGVFSGYQFMFVLVASIVCLILLFLIYHMPFDKKYVAVIVFMTLIISGGIGNMIDRAMIGSVTDFISFYLINFPIFNVADIYVSVATTLLIVSFLFIYKDDDIKFVEETIKKSLKKNK